jgi:hypothetical protein
LKLFVAAMASLVPGCKDDTPDPGELLVTAMIGPEGGQLAGAGVTLTVPPRAVTTDTLFELRAAGDNLSASSYRQSGGAYKLYPEALRLALPATLTFSEGPDNPAVLFQQDGMTVAGNGLTTYINELGLIAVATAGVRLTNADAPAFAPTPETATVIRDAIHFDLQVTDTPRVNVVLTLYDFDDVHALDLNGMSSEGDCGFQLEMVTGASLSAGCTEGPLTAQLRVTSPTVGFDAVPFQAGKVSPAVPVGVIAGGEDLSYFLGFVAFDTSPCYEETCQGNGVCMVDAAGAGACVCDPGFAVDAADPFTCNCVPVCDPPECGPDGCGGDCGPCGADEFCDGEGVCQMADDPTSSTGGPSTGDTGDPTMGSDGSTTMSDPTGTGTGTGTAT